MRAPSNLDEFAMDWSPTMIRTRDRHDHDASKRKKLAKGGLDALPAWHA